MENFINDPIRVMIVDDSSLIRSILTRALVSDPEITVITTATNGYVALNYIKKYDIEVLILDIEMPEMDGITALPKIIENSPNIKIIMVSSLSAQNAPVTIQALSLGASDYIEKPSAVTHGNNIEFFTLELMNKVKSLGSSARISNKSGSTNKRLIDEIDSNIILRPKKMRAKPIAIAIASSTGGPQALQILFSNLKKLKNIINVPIFITQHMPAVFTSHLADNIKNASGLIAKEAIDGENVIPATVYVAPGDYHMVVNKENYTNIINVTKDKAENYCRPSADVMLRSLVRVYRYKLLTIILSGMGEDGLKGSREVVEAGGLVVVQDKTTSVVWGMPGAVAKDGLASAIIPINKMADFLLQTIQ